MGFFAFSMLSSIVYVINDIKDVEQDKLHSLKRRRPLAAGLITKKKAALSLFCLFILLIVFVFFIKSSHGIYYAVSILSVYFALNIFYSFGAKAIPIIDITILASGYILRVIFGGVIIGVGISFWLYLVITLCAFYFGLGKRRNELSKQEKNTRKVLNAYTYNFLDKNMYVCQTLCIVFYALWSIDSATVQRLHTTAFIFTVPLIFLILLKYSLNIEANSDGDPISILFQDKILFALVALYTAISIILVCFGSLT
jgi:4-hydroxybenzoate polyprenyltransferase